MEQPFNWSNLSTCQNAGQAYTANPINTNVSAGAQCIPFVTCPAPISVVVSVVACNADQNAGQ
ncbi:hypothetical protein COD16_08675, partial [Bacillus thuringiensis]